MVKQDYFFIKTMHDHNNDTYFKIIDKSSGRHCYSTPRMLDGIITMLVNCIEEGEYVLQKNHIYDYKVWSIFLDRKVAKQKYAEYRQLHNMRKLRGELKAAIDWKIINYYLVKRKWNLDISKAK